jgi:ferritin-like metal-binding protein YciE/DNA integrity scanning protein DisA with diadenylate cyclase activity
MAPTLENMDDLFVHMLRRLYDAERQLTQILPKMAAAAGAPELKQAFNGHLKETQGQVDRIERLFERLDRTPNAQTGEGLKGIPRPGEDIINLEAVDSVRDAALIAAAQEAEHYEIAAYGTLRTWAQGMNKPEAVEIFERALDEEKRADEKLAAIAAGLSSLGPPPVTRDAEMDVSRALEAVLAQSERCDHVTLEAVLTLAVEIASEGCEGRPVGTLFTIGRPAEVLASSRPLILDPLAGHAPRSTLVTDERLRGTIKELAQLDGAFVIAEDGAVVSACRYLDASTAGIELPFGLGSRHLAAASISKRLGVIAVTVSATGTVRLFCDGRIVASVEHHR